MNWLKAFAAGFLGTLVFHQGLMGVLYLAGVSPRPPFPMAPTEPLGIPQVVSLAFWGGVWAMALMPLLRRFRGGAWLGAWTLAGALAPSAVALLIVFPLKGLGVAGGWDPKIIVGALLLNAAWGLGTALALKSFSNLAQRTSSQPGTSPNSRIFVGLCMVLLGVFLLAIGSTVIFEASGLLLHLLALESTGWALFCGAGALLIASHRHCLTLLILSTAVFCARYLRASIGDGSLADLQDPFNLLLGLTGFVVYGAPVVVLTALAYAVFLRYRRQIF